MSFLQFSMAAKKITEHIETAEEQRELFLWKYKDVPREDVNKMYHVSRTMATANQHISHRLLCICLCICSNLKSWMYMEEASSKKTKQ